MRYNEFRAIIQANLKKHPEGLTWKELKQSADLPYKTPCPTWVARLGSEIGLIRKRKKGNALIWELSKERYI